MLVGKVLIWFDLEILIACLAWFILRCVKYSSRRGVSMPEVCCCGGLGWGCFGLDTVFTESVFCMPSGKRARLERDRVLWLD